MAKVSLEQKQRARSLRSNMTDAEQLLWQQLRSKQFFGARFRRQVPLGAYIVDFLCSSKHIVIECDGGQHLENIRYDEQRDAYIRTKGYQVLRFWNHDILANTQAVLEKITQTIQ